MSDFRKALDRQAFLGASENLLKTLRSNEKEMDEWLVSGNTGIIGPDDVVLLSEGPCSNCAFMERKFEDVKRQLEKISVDTQKLRSNL